MRIPALLANWFRAKAQVTPMTVSDNSGLVTSTGGWFSMIRESFPGAWQSNIVIDGPRDVLAFSGVFAPLTLIASDISKLRIRLVEEDRDGICTEVDRNSTFVRVLRNPNHYQTRIQFVEQWILSKLLYGNTYVLLERDAANRVVKMYILDASRVKTMVTANGEVGYELKPDALSGLPETVRVPAREMIHDRWNCLWHPLVGVSPLYSAAVSATMGRKIQGNSNKFFENMSRPSGILSSPGKIEAEDKAAIKEAWEKNFSGGNIGRVAVLGSGMKYEAMTIPAEQAQMLEQLEWSARDTAAAFHMPLFKVGGPIPMGSSVEVMNTIYYQDALQGLIESMELCLDEGLAVPPETYTEFDIENLLRMDTAAQTDVLVKLTGAGIMAPNESRAKRNLKPVTGGKSPMIQQQNYSLEALAKRDAKDDPFAKEAPAKPPEPATAPTESPPKEPAKGVTDDQAKLYLRARLAERLAA